MDDWWPQLTASNNYQCVGKPSNGGFDLVNQNTGADEPHSGFLGLDLTNTGWVFGLVTFISDFGGSMGTFIEWKGPVINPMYNLLMIICLFGNVCGRS